MEKKEIGPWVEGDKRLNYRSGALAYAASRGSPPCLRHLRRPPRCVIDSEVANVGDSTANTAIPDEFAALLAAESSNSYLGHSRRTMMKKNCSYFAFAMTVFAVFCVQAVAVESIRIMPLGDSITRGSSYAGNVAGGYRTQLWKDLTNAGYAVDFVGESSENPDSGNLPDPDHNGYNGWRIDQIDAQVVAWMKKEKPGVVLLHIGSNDAIGNYLFSTVSTRLSNLITDITTESPQTHVIVAKIIGSTDAGTESRVKTFNSFVDSTVASHASKGERVTMVDMYSAIPTSAFSAGDPYHPNRTGYDLMGDTWFSAIQSLGAISNPTETPEPSSALLGASGLVALGIYVWRRRLTKCKGQKA